MRATLGPQGLHASKIQLGLWIRMESASKVGLHSVYVDGLRTQAVPCKRQAAHAFAAALCVYGGHFHLLHTTAQQGL
jgi:hypothetical protein